LTVVLRFTAASLNVVFVAVTWQVVAALTAIEPGAQLLERVTLPCCGTNATGMWRLAVAAPWPFVIGTSRI
jgi:hypothetical protein